MIGRLKRTALRAGAPRCLLPWCSPRRRPPHAQKWALFPLVGRPLEINLTGRSFLPGLALVPAPAAILVYMHRHARIHAHTNARRHAPMHARTHVRIHAYTHTRTHQCAQACTNAHTHACTHSPMCAGMHQHTHTCTLAHSEWRLEFTWAPVLLHPGSI